jgi:hypothetical protein
MSTLTCSGSNSFNEDTIEYFIYLFINTCCLNDLHLKLSMFKIKTKNNINILFNKFIKTFPKILTKLFYCLNY